MKQILYFISLTGLLMTMVPPILFFLGKITHSVQNVVMLLGAVIWFASAVFWLGSKGKTDQ
jgi:hypothetical protein